VTVVVAWFGLKRAIFNQPPTCRNTQPTSVVSESAPPHAQRSSRAKVMLDC
jgi:hypothetical protein